jgi:hypothetical protein
MHTLKILAPAWVCALWALVRWVDVVPVRTLTVVGLLVVAAALVVSWREHGF